MLGSSTSKSRPQYTGVTWIHTVKGQAHQCSATFTQMGVKLLTRVTRYGVAMSVVTPSLLVCWQTERSGSTRSTAGPGCRVKRIGVGKCPTTSIATQVFQMLIRKVALVPIFWQINEVCGLFETGLGCGNFSSSVGR